MPERVHSRFDNASDRGLPPSVAQQSGPPTTNTKKRKSLSNAVPPRVAEVVPGADSNKKSSANTDTNEKPLSASRPIRRPGLKEQATALVSERKRLPIWSHASEIRSGLQDHDVMLIVGETGSGKSTQVPQMLIEAPWCSSQLVDLPTPRDAAAPQISGTVSTETCRIGGCIAITEPRRVAAITLAERVAKEMGTPLGLSSPASKVGFSVRFNNSTSSSTRIKFLTEGMLLQEMLRDPYLQSYSAVVIDEVHERTLNVDLLLGFLRQIVSNQKKERGGVPLKVVIMSATAEMQALERFFDEGFRIPPVDMNSCSSLTDVDVTSDIGSEWSGLSDSIDDHKGPSAFDGHDGKISHTNHVSKCYVKGRQHPVAIHYEEKPLQNWLDATLRKILEIHYKEPLPGDILVFLTGQETVESCEKLLQEHQSDMRGGVPEILIQPLFAALPQDAQQAVFLSTPPRMRKVILATNIAETSVTVPGVRYVIDCGKAKMKHFRAGAGIDSLLVRPIARSAALQRMGRAGREGPGQCWRLYTELDYLSLPEYSTPEALRCDLSQALLTMQARGVRDIFTFPFLDRPERESYEKALMHLYQLTALDQVGRINDLGSQMAKLPLAGCLARTLLAATEPDLDCISEVIDIIASLSVENIFLKITSEESREQAVAARRSLYRREGDHLTLLATVQGYAAENADRKAWCQRHFVSHRAMKAVMDVRKQLRLFPHLLKSSNIESRSHSILTPETSVSILKCFIKGFAYNTALRLPDGSYETVAGHTRVAIHPSSVIFGKTSRAILFNELVFTSKSYARGVSAIEMAWLDDVWREPGV